MVKAILFYESNVRRGRRIVKVIENPLYLTKNDIEYYSNKIPVDYGSVSGDKYRPCLYMNYCGADYLLKEGGRVDDAKNGKG